MVHVAHDHFVDELRADGVVVEMMPAREFGENVNAQFIAEIEKFRVRRIMRQAHGGHVRIFQSLDIEPMNRLAEASTRIGPEGMAIGALQDHAPAVEIKAVTITHFEGAETKTLVNFVDDFIPAL